MEDSTQVWLTHTSEKIPFKVAKDENGNLRYFPGVAPFTAPQISSGSFSLESVNANVDVPIAFNTWIGGAGFYEADLQDPLGSTVYYYTRGVDASWPHRLYKSPQLQTGATTVEVPRKFVVSDLGLFVMTDTYIRKWSGSAWTQVFNAGGAYLNDLIEYKNSGNTYLVAALDDLPYYYSTTGTSWTVSESTLATPAYRSETALGSQAITHNSTTINKPSGVVENDILVLHAVEYGGTSATRAGAVGFTELTNFSIAGAAATGAAHVTILWRRAGASEGSSYVLTRADGLSGGGHTLVLTAFSGCVTSGNPFDDYEASEVKANVQTFSNAAVVSTDNGRLAVHVSVVDATANNDTGTDNVTVTFTPGTGWTELSETPYTSGTLAHPVTEIASHAQESGTLEVTNNFTASAASDGGGFTYLLKPVAVGPQNVQLWSVRGSSSGEPVLWAINGDGKVRNTIDPTDMDQWSGADSIQMGESNITFKGFDVMDNTFYLTHDKGITSYDGTSVSTVWNAFGLELEDEGARPYVWVDRRLYFTYSGALFRYENTENIIERVWPRGSQVGNGELNGVITAITGDSRNLYFSLKNGAGDFYIMKGDPTRSLTIDSETIYPFHSWMYRSTGDVYSMLVVPAGITSVAGETTVSFTGGAVGAAASIDLTVPTTVIEVTDGTSQAAAVKSALQAGDCRIWCVGDETIPLGSSQITLGAGPIQVFSESGTLTLNGESIDNATMFLQQVSDVFFGNVDFIISAGQDDTVSGSNNPAGVVEFTTSGADNLYFYHCRFTNPDVTAEFGSPNDGPETINVWNNGPSTADSPNNMTLHGIEVTRGVGDTKSLLAGGSQDAINFLATAYRSVFDTHQRSPRVGDAAQADWVNCVWLNNGNRIYGAAAADDGIFGARGCAIGKTGDSTPGRQEIDDDGTGNTIYAPTSGAGTDNNLLVSGTQGIPSIETTTSSAPSLPYTLTPETMTTTLMNTIIAEAGPGIKTITHQTEGGTGFSSTNPQLVIGDDTTADYVILPRYGLRPEDDTNYRFDTTDGNIFGAWLDGGAKTYRKFLNAGRLVGEGLTANLTVALKYQVDGGASATVGTYTTTGIQETSLSTDVEFARMRPVVTLVTNVNTAAPSVVGYSYSTTLNPNRKRTWVMDVMLDDEVEMPTGGESRYSWFKLEDFLFDALLERVTFTDRHNRNYTCKLDDIKAVTIGGDKEVYQLTLTEL